MSAKEPYTYTKEPYISAKEPYISTKEPYMSAKELKYLQKSPSISESKQLVMSSALNDVRTFWSLWVEKSPIYLQKSPIYPQRSPLISAVQKSPISCKRALYPAKEPYILQKSPISCKRALYPAKEPYVSAEEPFYM